MELINIFEKKNELNGNQFPENRTISIATMTFKPSGNGADKNSIPKYKVLRLGDIAYEGHQNRDFTFGRFLMNDIGDGIISPRFTFLHSKVKLNINFWKYYIHYEPIMRNILVKSTKQGTMMNELVVTDFLKQGMKVPGNSEQKIIGFFLTRLDQAITLQQRKHDLLKKLKQGYLQQMFPDKDLTTPRLRFSEFNGDWKQCEFTDLSKEIYGGGTPKTTNRSFWSGTLPWIQSSDIDLNDFYSINSSKYVSKEGLKNSSAKRIPENSITIVTRVGVGKLAYVPFQFSTSQDFISLSKLSVNPKFAIYLLYKLLVNLSRNSQGTSIKGITRNELFSKKFLIPTSKYEQAKIGEYLKMIDSLITLQQSKIKNLNTLKQAYLQKLFP